MATWSTIRFGMRVRWYRWRHATGQNYWNPPEDWLAGGYQGA